MNFTASNDYSCIMCSALKRQTVSVTIHIEGVLVTCGVWWHIETLSGRPQDVSDIPFHLLPQNHDRATNVTVIMSRRVFHSPFSQPPFKYMTVDIPTLVRHMTCFLILVSLLFSPGLPQKTGFTPKGLNIQVNSSFREPPNSAYLNVT